MVRKIRRYIEGIDIRLPSKPVIIAGLVGVLLLGIMTMAQASGTPLHNVTPGTIINFSGRQWIVLEQMENGQTYILLNEPACLRAFDPDGTNVFDPTDSNNIGYYLNNDFYNSLSQKELIADHSWRIWSWTYGSGYGPYPVDTTVYCKVALLNVDEYMGGFSSVYGGSILPTSFSYRWWLLWPDGEDQEYVKCVKAEDGTVRSSRATSTELSVRPVVFLQAGLMIDQSNNVNDGNAVPETPTGLTAVATSPTSVNLTWQANTDSDLAGYKVYRNGVEIATVGKVTSWTDNTASPGTTYTYELVAYNTSGQDSGRSNPATVTTPLDSNLLHDKAPGTIINFSGREWIVLEQMENGETYLILKEPDCQRAFDPDNTKLYDPGDNNNLAYYLNNDFYNGLSQKGLISEHSWDRISYLHSDDYDYGNVNCHIGLLSMNEYRRYLTASIFPGVYSFSWWLRTPGAPGYDDGPWYVNYNGNLTRTDSSHTNTSVRPTIYLQSGLSLDHDNKVIGGTACNPPTGLSAVATSPTSVNLTWQANTESDLAGYKIYRNNVEIAIVGKVTSYTDNTASPGTTYTYELVAYNTSGQDSGRSNPATVTTPYPPTPTTLGAIWKGDYIEVSWEAGTNQLDSQASLWRQMDNGPWMAIKTLTSTDKGNFVYHDRNVGVGVNCRYEIRESGGIDDYFKWTVAAESGWATGDRPMKAPGGLRIVSREEGTAVVTWNPAVGATTYTVQYSVTGQPWQSQTASTNSANTPRPSKVRVKAEGTYSHWSGALTVR